METQPKSRRQTISVSFKPAEFGLLAALDREAAKSGRDLSSVAREAIQFWLDRKTRKPRAKSA